MKEVCKIEQSVQFSLSLVYVKTTLERLEHVCDG